MPYSLLIGLALFGVAAVADEAAAGAELFARECAGCHGNRGEGGSDGEHPRLAGLTPPASAEVDVPAEVEGDLELGGEA